MFEQAFQNDEHQPFALHGGTAAALLVHGFPGTPAEMRPVGDALHAAGWTAHGVLLPGFGPQVETLADRKKEDWLAAVTSALRPLRQDHNPVLLVGNSMGAALSVEVAAQHPDLVDGLVLLSPFYQLDHVAWRALPLIQLVFPKPRLFRIFKPDFDNPEAREGMLNFMPDADLDDPTVRQAIMDYRVPIRMFAQIHRAGQTAYRLAPQVRVPVLVIQGHEDPIARPALTQRMIQRFVVPVQYHETEAEHNVLDTTRPGWTTVRQQLLDFAQCIVTSTKP